MQPALVPCRACNAPVSTRANECPRCGQPAQAAHAQSQRAGVTLLAILALCFGVLWYACSDFKRFSKEDDAKFCKEWLSYYDSFCKVHPDNCKEGPRKLARCDP
jgi:hypothetical protein